MYTTTKNSLTVIVPLYNQAKFVLECLDSVKKINSVNQIQLIIIDDCSKDDSVDKVEEWLLHSDRDCEALDVNFIKNKQNIGVCAVLNLALSLAKHEIIALCAADDFFLSDSISYKVAKLRDSPYDALLSDVYIVNENSEIVLRNAYEGYFNANPKALKKDALLAGEIITNWCIPGPSLLIKKSTYQKIGNYNTNLIVEDRDFYLRLFRDCSVTFDFEPIAAYRVHSTNISKESEFRKKMNNEIKKTNVFYSSSWKGLNRWYLLSYSLGSGHGKFSPKFANLIGRLLRALIRTCFKIKVLISNEK